MNRDNKENGVFLEHVDDLCRFCSERYEPFFTSFLDARQQLLAKKCAEGYLHQVMPVFFGGFCNAERQMAGFFPRDIYDYADKEQMYEAFPLKCVKISGSGFAYFSHRDVLGSVLALGIKREAVGDIFAESDKKSAYIALTKTAAGLVAESLEAVARDKVKVSFADVGSIPEFERKFSVISGTVASERLDCIIALACNVSREKAKTLISSCLVSVNHFEETRCDIALCEGDVLSVRGYGRFVLKQFGTLTRKERLRVVVHKMI